MRLQNRMRISQRRDNVSVYPSPSQTLQRNSFHQSNLNITVADLITAVYIPTQLWYLLIYSPWETTKNTDSIQQHLLTSIKINYKRPSISPTITIKLSFKYRFITWKLNFNSDFSGYWGFKISLLSTFITFGGILHYDWKIQNSCMLQNRNLL
jgi:hypothetical protein